MSAFLTKLSEQVSLGGSTSNFCSEKSEFGSLQEHRGSRLRFYVVFFSP